VHVAARPAVLAPEDQVKRVPVARELAPEDRVKRVPAARELAPEDQGKGVPAERAATPAVPTAASRGAAQWLGLGVVTKFEGAPMDDPAMCMSQAVIWISTTG
jgi:hypothetical protein